MTGSNTNTGNSQIDLDIPDEERHAKEDALSDIEFERFWGATFDMEQTRDIESRLILALCGRLGLRRAEFSHLQEDWIDWRNRRISIPHYYDCDLGRDNRVCGSCRSKARQREEYNEDITFEEALSTSWTPKTENAIREVPFGWSPKAEIALMTYFDGRGWDRWMYSAQCVNRRINRLVEMVDPGRRLYPHALRATAATNMAGAGMSIMALQSMFGWADASTAELYIVQNADMAERELFMVNV